MSLCVVSKLPGPTEGLIVNSKMYDAVHAYTITLDTMRIRGYIDGANITSTTQPNKPAGIRERLHLYQTACGSVAM